MKLKIWRRALFRLYSTCLTTAWENNVLQQYFLKSNKILSTKRCRTAQHFRAVFMSAVPCANGPLRVGELGGPLHVCAQQSHVSLKCLKVLKWNKQHFSLTETHLLRWFYFSLVRAKFNLTHVQTSWPLQTVQSLNRQMHQMLLILFHTAVCIGMKQWKWT